VSRGTVSADVPTEVKRWWAWARAGAREIAETCAGARLQSDALARVVCARWCVLMHRFPSALLDSCK
jgi:hypothetical protein